MRKLNIRIVLFTTSIILALGCISSDNPNEKYIILKNCNIIPMNIDTLLQKKNIVIHENKIIEISDQINKKYLKDNSEIIDCSNKFVIPGLFDSHFHYGRNEQLFAVSDSLLLKFGVTNVFSFHGSKELMNHKKEIDNKIKKGSFIISTGRNQYSDQLSKTEALKIIKDHKETGFKFIKVYTNLSKEGFNTFNAFNEAENLRLVGHIPREIGFFELMKSNQELIVHAEEFLYNEPVNYLIGNEDTSDPDYNLADTIAYTLKKYDKWVSPTLVTFKSILDQTKIKNLEIENSKSIKQIAEYWNWLPPNNPIPSKFNSDEKISRLKKGYKFQKLLVEKLDSYGVNILAGTDSPAYWGLVPGKSLHLELELLNDCGLTEYEALKAATINPAIFLNINQDYGSIEVNKIANLLILNKNPLDNIKNTIDINKVILNGKTL